MTYRQTVHHHIVSTFANLQTLVENRRQILNDFYNDRKQDVSVQNGDKLFIVPPAKDTADWESFIELVKNQGIEVEFAQSDFEATNVSDIWGKNQESKKFPAGTCIVKPAQPHRRLLRNLLDFDIRLSDDFLKKERKELENHKPTLLYDTSAWSLPICFGVEAFWADSTKDLKTNSKFAEKTDAPLIKGGFGYLIDFTSSDVYPLLVKLFEQNCQMRIATENFKMNGRDFDRGTILLRGNENPDNLFEILQKLNPKFNAKIIPLDTALVDDWPDLGTRKFELLSAPKTALASQWPVSSNSFGSIWFLIDRNLNLKCTPFNIQNINGIDLRIYNVLILPDCPSLDRLLDSRGIEKIRNWVRDGGTLIAVEGSAAFCADANNRLSAVRLKQFVLGKLDEYAEAVKRERDVQNIKIDPNIIWGKLNDNKDTNEPEKNRNVAKTDVEKLRRDDTWQQIFSPHGAFLSAGANNEHWLCFGLDKKMAVLFDGQDVFMSKYPVQTPVRFSDAQNLRVSGLLWPEAKSRIADSAYATVESAGRGQIILFATDPTYRMWVPEQERLLKNAILLGPGLGTSQPNPW